MGTFYRCFCSCIIISPVAARLSKTWTSSNLHLKVDQLMNAILPSDSMIYYKFIPQWHQLFLEGFLISLVLRRCTSSVKQGKFDLVGKSWGLFDHWQIRILSGKKRPWFRPHFRIPWSNWDKEDHSMCTLIALVLRHIIVPWATRCRHCGWFGLFVNFIYASLFLERPEWCKSFPVFH